MSLRERLIAQIAASGPMPVADYMTVCLHDPRDGYYATRPALGEGGDFLTSPMVSQMFGELIGLWMVSVWRSMGRPAPFRLVEIGAGDGTLMEDLRRAAARDPDFLAAADLWLVEVSPPLKASQAARLGGGVSWADRLEQVPDGAPLLLVANEVLDCLPAHQFVRTETGWARRVVGLSAEGDLVFGLSPLAPDPGFPEAPAGAVLERSPAQAALGTEIGHRLAADGGAALIFDYGRDSPGFGDTLQALKAHRKLHPLEAPGEADLTVHADFPAVAAASRSAGAVVRPLLSQGEFLNRLGLGHRAETLARARPDRAEQIERQVHRLAGEDQMGRLFKVLCVHSPGLDAPGFEAGA